MNLATLLNNLTKIICYNRDLVDRHISFDVSYINNCYIVTVYLWNDDRLITSNDVIFDNQGDFKCIEEWDNIRLVCGNLTLANIFTMQNILSSRKS